MSKFFDQEESKLVGSCREFNDEAMKNLVKGLKTLRSLSEINLNFGE